MSNILILGSGGREHALAHKIKQSPKCNHLFVAPGNAGTQALAENLDLDILDFEGVAKTIKSHDIDTLIVGPEAPLVTGIADFFKHKPGFENLMLIGPSKQGAELEGSKQRAKTFMKAHNIPTAQYKSFTAETLQEGQAFLETLKPPYVLKADGLAGGKGVLILNDLTEAKEELAKMLKDNKFGKASEIVVIEEFLDGIELSVFVLTDGKNYKILPNAKDYKRIGEADSGLNTGGMGAVSPVPFADEEFLHKVEEKIVKPTIEGLQKENIDYKGFIFIGLMKVGAEPFVVEYNVRMGDPETEVVMPRLDTDLVDLLQKTATGNLAEAKLDISTQAAATVMLVSGGYPENYEKGKKIIGLDEVKDPDVIVFHAGTKISGDDIVTSGGRVIAITAMAEDYNAALKKSYTQINKICYDNIYYRKDIGFDLKN